MSGLRTCPECGEDGTHNLWCSRINRPSDDTGYYGAHDVTPEEVKSWEGESEPLDYDEEYER